MISVMPLTSWEIALLYHARETTLYTKLYCSTKTIIGDDVKIISATGFKSGSKTNTRIGPGFSLTYTNIGETHRNVE